MKQTLVLQNPQWSGQTIEGLHNRSIMDNLLKKKDLPHIQILTGVRRAGKSTVFKLLINDLLKSGVNPRTILNINLDAPCFIPMWDNAAKISEIIDAAEFLTGEKIEYLFLDEIQQITSWEIFIKSIYDARRFKKIYITGSNSNMLQSRFAAMLSGRYFENRIYPFSIKEYLASENIKSLLDAYQNVPAVLRLQKNMMEFGSFPEVAVMKADDSVKMELLHSYFESIVQKDCIVYNSIRDVQMFYNTVNYILRNAGNRFSISQLSKSLKSNDITVTSYLQYLCDSHICSDIRNFSYSLKETKRSEHKCYCVDNGLMSANTFRYSKDDGSFFENLVYNELQKRGYENISFDNSNGECDFLVTDQGSTHAFQVCFELNAQNRERELRGFDVPDVNLASKTLITFNQRETLEDRGIQILPLWEWAMQE